MKVNFIVNSTSLKAIATAASPIIWDETDLECSVCSEIFNIPKLLHCGHLLCRQCLINWLTTKPNAQCPLCRFPILNHSQSVSHGWAAVADEFLTDVAMEDLVEVERLMRLEKQCCFCDKAKGEALCLDCSDVFCVACKPLHTKPNLLQQHKVHDIRSLSREQLEFTLQEVKAEKKGRKIPSAPLLADHDDEHGGVDPLAKRDEALSGLPQPPDVPKTVSECRAALRQMRAMLRETERGKEIAIAELEKLDHDTQATAQNFLTELDNLSSRLKDMVEGVIQREKQKIKDEVSAVSDALQSRREFFADQQLDAERRPADRRSSALSFLRTATTSSP